jgi:hypothetical protein
MKVRMLVTLVAVLCNSQLCLEKVVITSEQSSITMTACRGTAQIRIAERLANGPYREAAEKLQVRHGQIHSQRRSMKCIPASA